MCGAVAFGLLHVYWALGGRIGVPAGVGDIHDRPFFLAYDIAAGVIFLAYDIAAGVIFLAFGAVAAVLALDRAHGRWRSRLLTACWWGGWLSLLRGGAALVQSAFMLGDIDLGIVYDVVFVIGGVIFIQIARAMRHPAGTGCAVYDP